MENKSYNFSNIRFSDLQKIISIKPVLKPIKFKEWFSYPYKLTKKESLFLKQLINKHALLLPSYLEENLKMKFISPILNQVDFMSDNIHDWYEANFCGCLGNYELKGFVDYIVATGVKTPEKPYFFIQEFKPTQADKDVEDQLLAEMLVAIEKNQTYIFRGAYIIGQIWKFVIVEKIAQNQFEYFVSEAFDCLKIKDLKQIYINLQAVKHLYCKD